MESYHLIRNHGTAVLLKPKKSKKASHTTTPSALSSFPYLSPVSRERPNGGNRNSGARVLDGILSSRTISHSGLCRTCTDINLGSPEESHAVRVATIAPFLYSRLHSLFQPTTVVWQTTKFSFARCAKLLCGVFTLRKIGTVQFGSLQEHSSFNDVEIPDARIQLL